jgi:glycosyltransferase involved in cell wall biosynthesis
MDLTVATNIFIQDGIGRQGIGIIDLLKDDLDINVLKFQPQILDDVPEGVIEVLKRPLKKFGKVTFWTYILGLNEQFKKYHSASDSPIKIAYTMLESSAIPTLWVNILNEYYDMVVVPDENLVKVYKKSGVKKPIFVLPLGIMIEEFLEQPIKENKNDVFTFGMTSGFWLRKNQIKLINAFAKKYKNNSNFKLKIHGRFGSSANEVKKVFDTHNFNNAELSTGRLPMKQYLDWFKSLDCYVFPSQGEGFSITPRESLALGIPAIVSNNTVHKTIINSGNVVSLKANNKVPARYEVFNNKQFGYFYDCSEDDLIDRMEYVVNNYETCLEQAKNGRKWVKQYLWSSLKNKYLSMLNPKEVKYGKDNKIIDNGIITNSRVLVNKWKKVL